VTDALTIAVSEERGTVTVFSEGRMQQVRDASEIQSKIASHWKNTDSYLTQNPRKGQRWETISQISACFLFAFILWYLVGPSRGEIREMVFPVQIEYIPPPKDIVIVGRMYSTVDLRLAASELNMDSINPSRLRVQLDLSRKAAGKYSIPITEDMIKGLPSGVSLRDADPSSLQLSLEKLKLKLAEIKPNLVGELPDGLVIKSIRVEPRYVRVLTSFDDESRNDIQLTTTPIDLSKIKENAPIVCQVVAPVGMKSVDPQWPQVEVTIEAQPQLLFGFDLGGLDDLSPYFIGNRISDDFSRRFRYRGVSLSKSATVSALVKDDTWLITDDVNGRSYLVKKERNRLNVYRAVKN
jgi:YbbR domain-containing protein